MADANAFRIGLENRKVWDRKCQMEGVEKVGDKKILVLSHFIWFGGEKIYEEWKTLFFC